MENIIELCKKFKCAYAENESMSLHTTFKIGGNARLIVYPQSALQVSEFVRLAKKENIRLIAVGNGSNLLVADEGIDACVMILGKDMAEIRLEKDDVIFAEAGAKLQSLCRFALENSLTGLEFAYGIPGSCGGAAFMNAGAYGGEMKDVLFKCEHIDENGDTGFLCGDDLKLAYRHSAYYDNGCIITGLYLKLKKGNKQEIKSKMDDFMSRRKAKQPLEFPSAGSTFKRPEGYFAGALIEECNLKGKAVGGAKVSEKHAGFVINNGGATCRDVLDLCQICSDTVYSQKGVRLEMEIRVTK
ncbi:MAG: UDP-N-acetylmuramate dehydrogenase [Clostridiales bacterium]|nr:UDP-N-acetylmuramate dehydrogenase [Clostridiales bacterium]